LTNRLLTPPHSRDLTTKQPNPTRSEQTNQQTRPVGGNHEAPNYLWELYHGGWAAPNIYFLGYAGVVRFGGLRIGGLSGIFNEPHYRWV
jgi:lariat debranching enzyme